MPDLWWIYTSNREPGYFDGGFMSKVSPRGVLVYLFMCMMIFSPARVFWSVVVNFTLFVHIHV